MARCNSLPWFSFLSILLIAHSTNGQEGGFSGVLETDQDILYYSPISDWVCSGRPGLFKTDDFKMDNSTFSVKDAGVYYVTANLIIKAKQTSYYWYRRTTVTWQGKIYLSSEDYISYTKQISSSLTMRDNEQKNLRISGYVQLESGWKVSIQVSRQYGWKGTLKAGSTLSMMYASKPSLFPGVLLRTYSYSSLYLESPSYSASVDNWDEIDEGSTSPTTEGGFLVPHKGLYHILVNLNIRRYYETTLKISIVINNETEAINKTAEINSGGINTVTIEGILDLTENQTISVTISNPKHHFTSLSIRYGSTFFIFYKGSLNSHSLRALSTCYQDSSTQMPSYVFSTLKQWDTSSQHSLTHYGNVQLQQGEFVAPKSGTYQINFALYLSNCTNAKARISVKKPSGSSYQAISPDVSFNQESMHYVLQNSLLLKMQKSDRLRIQVKSDVMCTVLSQTSYQIVLQTSYTLWPAAIFILAKPFQFKTNSPPVKVQTWSHHTEGNWNDLFFDVNKHTIEIQVPGLYLISYNLVVSTTSVVPFYSHIVVNDKLVAVGSSCQRGSASEIFTCTASTLLNLVNKDKLAVRVWMSDKSKNQKTVTIQNSTRFTVTLLGDTRSNPAFKLNTQPPSKPYTTKAGNNYKKSLSDFTFPNASFFQSAALYSKSTKTFNSGKGNGYILLNSVQFNQQNDGYLASAVGSGTSNMTVYSRDHKKSHFSLPVSDLSVDSNFYFNVCGKASSKSELKWQPESGSVVSGVYVGNKETMTSLKAGLKLKKQLECATGWTKIGIADWHLQMLLNNLGKITPDGVQIKRSGFYLTSLNLAVTADTSNTVIDVGIFVDQNLELSGSETSPTDGRFSIFLQSVVQVTQGQYIDIKAKCSQPTNLTYAEGGGIFSLKIDQAYRRSALRKRMRLSYLYDDDKIGTLRPWNYYHYRNDDNDFEEFVQDIEIDHWKIKVKQSGVYLISMVGFTKHAHGNFEIAFASPANKTDNATCPMNSSPLTYKTSSDHLYSSIALTGFVLLDKDDNSGFLGKYDYWGNYESRFFMTVQFVGDLDTSSGFTATLKEDTSLQSGTKQLSKNSWNSGKTCAKFTTKDVPTKFSKYKVLYSGYYLVSMNLILDHKDGSNVEFCFTVNGKGLTNVAGVKGLNLGCFIQHLATENQTSTSTLSGSELLYLEANEQLSVQISTSLPLTISKKSSFSAFYLGTAGTILGFSSVIKNDKTELRELPSYYNYYDYYRRYDDDEDYAQYVVQGWTKVPKTKMFFENEVKINSTFITTQNGIYLVMVKMRISAKNQFNDSCKVKLELAVDGEVMDFAFVEDFVDSVDTMSFATTLRLEKWQGVSVRLSKKRLCASMIIKPGSSLAFLYLDGGKAAFTLWPNIGPHIVEFPAESSVLVREDKTATPQVTCLAVGEYDITYEWKTYYTVVSESRLLDTKLLNDTTTSVQCVATMRGLVEESGFVRIKLIDPTIIFGDDYWNRTYYLPEKNDTTTNHYEDVLEFGVSEKRTGYYYWYWQDRIDCKISEGNDNSTFIIQKVRSYYGYGDDHQRYKLRAWLPELDREEQSEYNIEITCENLEYDDAKKAVTTIHIDILDANDNLPVFDEEIYFAKVGKNIHSGDDIIQVQATDDDAGENGKIKYTLVPSSSSYIFTIDTMLGVISLRDMEKIMEPNYRITVKATDQGTPPRSSYVTVVIEVQDFPTPRKNHTNKNPVFPQQLYTAYLIWDTPKGTPVCTVHAHDPDTFDHQDIRYYIFKDDSVIGGDSVFEVDAKTGLIKTKGSVKKGEYHLEIAAEYENKPGQQPGQFYNTTKVFVFVRMGDISMPHFLKEFREISLPENSKINTKVVQVTAHYGDNKPVEYYLPNTQSSFKIDKNSGQISLAKELDYEEQKDYTFVASVRDPKHKTKSDCVEVTVHVLDSNDNAPVINDYPRSIRVDVSKGTQKIGHVKAEDKDVGRNGEIRYYLKDDTRGRFEMSNRTGELFVKGHLDCCDGLYHLEVIAKDQGIPSLDSKPVDIEIIPYNSQPPHTRPPHTRPPHPRPTAGPHTHPSSGPDNHPASGSHTGGLSDEKKYIIGSVVGGVAVVIILAGVIYMRRRKQRQSTATLHYINLHSDEEDDPLLDDESDHGDDRDSNRRLSLISDASDDNLLRNEAPC